MKTPVFLVGAVAIALSLSSCHLKEKYVTHDKATVAYLADSKTAPAKLNVEGLYYSPEWGIVALNQSSGKIDGLFPDYIADGVVSGRKAYIVLRSGTWAYYTVEVSRQGDDLVGFYSSSVPFKDADKRAIKLTRID